MNEEPEIDWEKVDAAAREAYKVNYTVLSGYDFEQGYRDGYLARAKEEK